MYNVCGFFVVVVFTVLNFLQGTTLCVDLNDLISMAMLLRIFILIVAVIDQAS